MSELEQRALKACQRYEAIDKLIKYVGHQISIEYCLTLDREGGVGPYNTPLVELCAAPSESCLDKLFRHNLNNGYRCKRPPLCEGCQSKYDAIQRRKHLRQLLGAAKREIIRVGRASDE